MVTFAYLYFSVFSMTTFPVSLHSPNFFLRVTLDIYTDFWSANPDKIYNLISACCSDFRVFYRFKILLDTFILDGLFFLFSEMRSFMTFLFFQDR